jgi:hypothetical protein
MTGHFTSYENRTDHELATPCVLPVAGGDKGQYPQCGADQTP